MSIPTLDEQFLPRLIAVFYAVFHPTEGPKVIYQVPEGSITEEEKKEPPNPTSSQPGPSASVAVGTETSGPTPKTEIAQHGGLLGGEPLFDFSALSEYLIPKAPLCGRLVTSIARGTVKRGQGGPNPPYSRAPSAAFARSRSARSGSSRASSARPKGPDGSKELEDEAPAIRSYKILGFPTLIEDAARYRRNNFIFNLCFVFDGHADVRAYEPVVRKCGRMLRSLEESQSFLSSPRSLPRMYAIIEQLFEDLNSYCESFVALPEAPHTSYLKSSSKPNSPQSQKLTSPLIGPDDFVSLGASFASLRDEHHKKLINEHLKQMQAQMHGSSSRQASSINASRDSASQQNQQESRSRTTSESGDADAGHSLGAMSPVRPGEQSMTRSNSATGTSGPAADRPNSPGSSNNLDRAGIRRPSIARSSTITAFTEAASQGASPSIESRDTAMGILTPRRQSELTRELSAAESLGIALSSRESGAFDSINTPQGTRRSSRGSMTGPGAENEVGSLEQLTESIVSLRTIDAALSNSVNALRSDTVDSTHRAALAEKREPPHGLGRTVRDAINLKLFPVYPNPPPVNDWDVPVALLDLGSRVDGNWDLTMRRIFPFIDGVCHVKRIAQLADADLGLTRACLEHLIYYGCIITVDIFQYFNMYTVRPAIAKMADDEAMGRECAAYVTRPGHPIPSYPELLRLYSLLRAGKTLNDWIEDNDIDDKGIDVRRFVSFGVIQGFLRRVHRYPVYLGGPAHEDVESRPDTSVVSTARNSPIVGSKEGSGRTTQQQQRRDESGSREPRDRRPRELSGMSGAYSAFQRIGRDGSVDSPGVGTRTPTRRAASEARFGTAGGSQMTDSTQLGTAAGSSNFGTSPTKRLNRPRQRPNYRHPTTTAMDVASVAFQVGENDSRWSGGVAAVGPVSARSPRKRASAVGLGSGIGGSGVTASAGGSAAFGASGISQRSGVVAIPAGLIDLLDGTHNEDELCVTFSVSWPELEKMLIQIGMTKDGHGGRRASGVGDSEEDDPNSSHRGDWKRWQGSGGGGGQSTVGGMTGASSGWSKHRLSGFSGVGVGGTGTAGKSALSGVTSSGHPSSSNRTGTLAGDSSILLNNASASGFGIGPAWGVDPDESGVAGWSGFSALDRQAIESGDLGRVRILLQ